jgi:hypothetical protein
MRFSFSRAVVAAGVVCSLGVFTTTQGCSSESAASCVPGAQVSCPCAGGGTGVQTCNTPGTGYEPCESCGASQRDGSADAPSGRDARRPPDDGSMMDRRDGSMEEASRDVFVSEGGGCVYPTDGLYSDASAALPTPTPGTCQGNSAVTCTASHVLASNACGAGSVCTVYSVIEHPGVGLPQTGRTYDWAACIPAGTTPCTFTWSANPPNYSPPGSWMSSYTGNCQANDALTCMMAPIIGDQAYEYEWAGTTTGYVNVAACGAGEACADNPAEPGHPGCYASPLVSCSPVANSTCSGDVLYSCNGGPYQVTVDCASQGQKCREDCPIGLPETNAECRDPLPQGATPCDPSTFTAVCSGSTDIQDCNPGSFNATAQADCFMSSGQCVCYPTSHPCGDIGCGDGSSDCICANVVSQGAQCIVSGTPLCDPSITPDSCQGTTAQMCTGYVVTQDCALLGEICSVADGYSGCIASPATPCTPGPAPSCTVNTLSGCCPASGEFGDSGLGATVVCAPGFMVSFACSALNSALTCTTTGGIGACAETGM